MLKYPAVKTHRELIKSSLDRSRRTAERAGRSVDVSLGYRRGENWARGYTIVFALAEIRPWIAGLGLIRGSSKEVAAIRKPVGSSMGKGALLDSGH